jgi:hypothetical protein
MFSRVLALRCKSYDETRVERRRTVFCQSDAIDFIHSHCIKLFLFKLINVHLFTLDNLPIDVREQLLIGCII